MFILARLKTKIIKRSAPEKGADFYCKKYFKTLVLKTNLNYNMNHGWLYTDA